jgi:hypothetical protein
MQDSKDSSWASNFSSDAQDEAQGSGQAVERPANANGSSDPDGWQQYRRWISKAPVPKQRRGGIDPSLYTWKGYRSWTEQVKRNWSED